MEGLEQFLPYDKSHFIRYIFTLLYRETHEVITKNDNFSSDMLSALECYSRLASGNFNINVGESGTLLRFASLYIFLKTGENPKGIIREGTLCNRKISKPSEVINLPIKAMLKLDGGTSQWASAAYLLGVNQEKISNPPYRLNQTYEFTTTCGPLIIDSTIKEQAHAIVEFIGTGGTSWKPKHSEDYCLARALGIMSKEAGAVAFPQVVNHESNRLDEMEHYNEYCADHRVIQAYGVMQAIRGEKFTPNSIQAKALNKSWPQFQNFLTAASKNIKP